VTLPVSASTIWTLSRTCGAPLYVTLRHSTTYDRLGAVPVTPLRTDAELSTSRLDQKAYMAVLGSSRDGSVVLAGYDQAIGVRLRKPFVDTWADW
jgi:hypothetical protein